jgi:AcrR family transcriptional regulator
MNTYVQPMKKRKYELRRRAEAQEETRQKIVDATVELHEELGPRATTISAIAERAGVQRLTVYRHFPDDTALFGACSSQWFGEHPLPDPAIWRSLNDWRSRCRAGLAALYSYYRRNTAMLASVMRDADLPAMQAPMQGFVEYFGAMHHDLTNLAEPSLAKKKDFAQTIRHAIAFPTWQSFADAFADEDLVALVLTWLEGIAAGGKADGA